MRRLAIFVFTTAATLAGFNGLAVARSSFDGLWSVLVVTESGTCDRGYRYAVRIADGRVQYEGEAAINVNGRVAPNGSVRVTIRRGDQGADGTGRLSGGRGAGRWTAAAGGRRCSGTWTAERRG